MRDRSASGLRHILLFIATGCMLGGLTVVATGLGSSTPVLAACNSVHQNAEGYDNSYPRYGNHGRIYVNTSATIGGLQAAIHRSLFVVGSFWENDVEVGWTANNGSHSGPTVFSEWVNRGSDSGPRFYTGISLLYDTDYKFEVKNVGHVKIFRYVVDGESSPFDYSPTMNFNLGTIVTNSERRNTCDTMYTEMTSLGYIDSNGNLNFGYGHLACFYNPPANGWKLNIIDNQHIKVDANTGVTCTSPQ